MMPFKRLPKVSKTVIPHELFSHVVGYIKDESHSSFNVYLLWKRFFRYNLGLFKMKKYIFTLPQDSNYSKTFFFFNLRVKTEHLQPGF